MPNELAVTQPANLTRYQSDQDRLTYLMGVAKVLYDSGYTDAENVDQVVAKLLYGDEVGLSPMHSLNVIHVIPGAGGKKRLVLDYTVLAGWIKADPNYDYSIKTHTRQECVVVFLRDGEILGESAYSWQEASQAGLIQGAAWQKHAKDMLFKTALTKGVRMYCPDIVFRRGGALEVLDDRELVTVETETPSPYDTETRRLASSLGITETTLLNQLRQYATEKGLQEIDLSSPYVLNHLDSLNNPNQ